jgi:hypothetical protein
MWFGLLIAHQKREAGDGPLHRESYSSPRRGTGNLARVRSPAFAQGLSSPCFPCLSCSSSWTLIGAGTLTLKACYAIFFALALTVSFIVGSTFFHKKDE